MKVPTRIRRRRVWAAAALASTLVAAPAADARPDPGTGAVDRPAPVVEVRSNGFDWADAGIGAGSVAGLSLLAAAAVTLGQRRQRAVGC